MIKKDTSLKRPVNQQILLSQFMLPEEGLRGGKAVYGEVCEGSGTEVRALEARRNHVI